MADPLEPSNPAVSDVPPSRCLPQPRRRPFATDIVPIGPNLLATFASFIVLMVAPWICLHTLQGIWEDAIGDDRIGAYFILANLEESFQNAGVGTLLFLVVGAILQAWRHHRPFPWRRPIVLAFPIAGVLVLPESLLPGGSILSGIVVSLVLATAFGVHWGLIVAARDAME